MPGDTLIDSVIVSALKGVLSRIGQPPEEDVECGLHPQEALGILKDGNCKYQQKRSVLDVGAWDPESNSRQQSPIAVIVCCSDSRVPPELVFWQGLGRLFVTRVAGNTVDAAALGSIAYAVTTFKTPLVVVLGHEKCGAVKAAVEFVEENKEYPDILDAIVKPIIPAVKEALKHHKDCGDLWEASMRESVKLTVASLSKSLSHFLQNAKGPDHVWIVGARYDVNNGAVDFFKPVPL